MLYNQYSIRFINVPKHSLLLKIYVIFCVLFKLYGFIRIQNNNLLYKYQNICELMGNR